MPPPTATAEPVIMDVIMVGQLAHGVSCQMDLPGCSPGMRSIHSRLHQGRWIESGARPLRANATHSQALLLMFPKGMDRSVLPVSGPCSRCRSGSFGLIPLRALGCRSVEGVPPARLSYLRGEGSFFRSRRRNSPPSAKPSRLGRSDCSEWPSGPSAICTRASLGYHRSHANLNACGPPR